ncbi:MAG: hypothetical protein NTT76_19655 [Achromobacter xylosoxidans]|nr:hypothetical protein [Achromobacter xylosoxidans]
MAVDTIDPKTLSQLVEAGFVLTVHVVGSGNGWKIAARCGETKRFLSAKCGDVRVFRKLETLVAFLRELGISRFDVDAADFDPASAGRSLRPDRSVALKDARAELDYDKWFHDQVQQALDDPRSPIPHAKAKAEFAERRAALRRRMTNRGGN